MKEQLIAQFGGAKPTVQNFHKFLNGMPLEERGIFFDRMFGLDRSGNTLPVVFGASDQGEPPAVCGYSIFAM